METVQAVCEDCSAGFIYTRKWGVYGHKRKRCDRCQKKHERKMTAARVRKHRSNAKPAQQFRYHLRGWDGRALCGRGIDGQDMVEFMRNKAHDGKTAILCKACDRILAARQHKAADR